MKDFFNKSVKNWPWTSILAFREPCFRHFCPFLSIFAYFRVENLSDQVKCWGKGVPRQNTNSSKKCCEKGAVLRKGGVAKRATSGVCKIRNFGMISCDSQGEVNNTNSYTTKIYSKIK